MNIDTNILTASNSERVEFALLIILFALAGSYAYQKINFKEISPDILIYCGFGSLAPYLCLIGPFFWHQIAVIITGLLFGIAFTYRIT